jgi:hypothetical protein
MAAGRTRTDPSPLINKTAGEHLATPIYALTIRQVNLRKSGRNNTGR